MEQAGLPGRDGLRLVAHHARNRRSVELRPARAGEKKNESTKTHKMAENSTPLESRGILRDESFPVMSIR